MEKEQHKPEDSSANSTDMAVQEDEKRYLTKWRLYCAILGLSLGVILPSMEVSIISTSLITISQDLHGYSRSSWIVTAYLLTYTGFLIIWAKLAEIFGLKRMMMTSLVLFMAFSGGCGASQNIDQLIINRAFQGIGGSGLYSLVLIAFIQLVPPRLFNLISAVGSLAVALGLILGPLVGGAINNSGAWRWAFLLNLPAGAVCFLLLGLVLPHNFPLHAEPAKKDKSPPLFVKVDFLGAFFLLAATVLLITALSEGGVRYPWRSGSIISIFILSGLSWAAFLAWQRYLSRDKASIEPIFPWRFFSNRVWMGVLLGSLLAGASSTIAFIEIPQRFQIVNGNDPLDAGVKLLTYAAGILFGTTIPTGLSKIRMPYIVSLSIGTAAQIVSFSLLSTIPTTYKIWPGSYGYYMLAGLGVGASLGTQYMMAPLVVSERDKNVSIGTVVQMRMLGGALGIAVANAVLSSHVRSHLKSILPAQQVEHILESPHGIGSLPRETQASVREIYGEAYNLQMKAAIGFCAAQVLSVVLTWKNKQIRFSDEMAKDRTGNDKTVG